MNKINNNQVIFNLIKFIKKIIEINLLYYKVTNKFNKSNKRTNRCLEFIPNRNLIQV